MFEGKRAFVTGVGTGIGRACALALAAEGCFVTVAGRTEHTLDETVRLISEAGGSAQAVPCDVTVEAMVQWGVAAAGGDEDRLHAAGHETQHDGSASLPSSEWTSEMLDQMLVTNVRGTFLPMKYELVVMQRRGSGGSSTSAPAPGCWGCPDTRATSRPSTPASARPGAPRSSTPPRASASTRSRPGWSTRRSFTTTRASSSTTSSR